MKMAIESSRRKCLIRDMELAIQEAVNERVDIAEDDDSVDGEHFGTPCRGGGKFKYIESGRVTITLDGDDLLGWYADDRPTRFSGSFMDAESGHELDWSASLRRATRTRRTLAMTLDVEADLR